MKLKNLMGIMLFVTMLLVTGLVFNSCNKSDDEPEPELNNGGDDNDDQNGNGDGTTTLPAPTGFSLSQTSSYVKLIWNEVSGASSYYVCRALPSDEQYAIIKETISTSYLDYDVTAGTTYYYAVAAVNSSGYGVLAEQSITFNGNSGGNNNGGGNNGGGTANIAAPTGLTASQTSSSVVLSWNPLQGVIGYAIYRSTPSTEWDLLDAITSNSYTDNAVIAGTTYYYAVAGVDADYNVGANSQVSITFNGSNNGGGNNQGGGNNGGNSEQVPSAPTGLTATQTGTKAVPRVALSWDAVSGADHYVVYRSMSSSGTYSSIGTAYYSEYNDSNVSNGKTYYYRVKAANSSNKESGYSNTASCKIEVVWQPAAPKVTSVKFSGANNSTITIKWDYEVVNNAYGMPDQVKLTTERRTKKGNYYVFDWTTASSKKTITLTMDDLNYGDNNVAYDQNLYLEVKNSSGEAKTDIIWGPTKQAVYVGGSQNKYFNP